MRRAVALIALVGLAACEPAPPPQPDRFAQLMMQRCEAGDQSACENIVEMRAQRASAITAAIRANPIPQYQPLPAPTPMGRF